MKQTATLTSLSGSLGRSVKIILTLLFLNFFVQNVSAQTVKIDGLADSGPAGANEWCQAGLTHIQDLFGNGVAEDQFAQGSKDFFFAVDWRWAISQTKGKNDLANVSAGVVPAGSVLNSTGGVVSGGPFLVFAGDRLVNNGDAQIGFWFFQDGTAPVVQPDLTQNFSPPKNIGPGATIGDLLILANFTGGGRDALVTVLEWVGSGGNYADNAAFNLLTITAAVAENNAGATPVPGCFDFPDAEYDDNQFFEGFVNLAQFGAGSACFSRVMLEGRSSQEITASLDDFVGGPLGSVPNCSIAGSNTICAGSSTCFTATGGSGTFTYSWTGPVGFTPTTGAVICNLTAAGTYNVIVSNATGCTSACSRTLVVNSNPTAGAGPDEAKCQTAPSGPTAFTLAGTGTNGTFAWTQIGSTGGASASITTPTSLTSGVSVSGIGTVTLRLTTTSNATPSCGTATDNVVLTVNANPTANAGPDEAKCQTAPSGPTAFTLAGTGANGTFAWTQVGATGTASASITTPTSLTSGVSVSGIGTVTLRLTTTSNATPSCGTATDNVILTVNANPTANAGPDDSKCQTAPSGPTAFTLAGTGANGTFAWTQTGSTGTASASITSPTSLTSGVSVSGIGTVTLKLTTTSNATPSCGTATDEVVLTVTTLPTANAGPDEAKCQTPPSGPTAFTLAGTGTGTATWTQIGSTGTASASITTPSSLTSGVNVSGIGTVTLHLAVASASCGTATDNVVLTVNANPTANAGPDESKCQTAPSGPTAFTLAGTGANGTFAWTQVGSTGTASASITTPTSLTSGVSVSGIGTVTLRLTTTSNATPSCGTATDNVVLTVNPNPTANAGTDPLAQCRAAAVVNGSLVFGTNVFSVTGSVTNANPAVPAWTIAPGGNPSGYTVAIVSPNSLTTNVNISGTINGPGTVTLRLTGTSNATPSCGTATDDVVLTINAVPDLKPVVGSDFCPNVTTTGSVSLLNSQLNVSYQLKDDADASIQAPKAGTGGTLTWFGLAEGNYTVVGTFIPGLGGCNSRSGPGEVIENPVPEVTITPVGDKCNTDPCVPLTALPAGGTFSGTGVIGTDFCPDGLAPGAYTVTYSYTNIQGCTASNSITINVASCAAQICTYTQGYFGNPGGLSCDGTDDGFTTTELINQSLGNWPGTFIRIGVSQTGPPNIQNYVQINDGDAAWIIEVLPGGGPAKEVSGANQISSLPASMLQNGRIHNVLLAQTIALGLNIGITSPSTLGDFILKAGTLYTAKPLGGCGSSVPTLRVCNYDPITHLLILPVQNEYLSRSFSQALIDAIEDAGYPKTVNGLFGLANDAIGNKDGVVGTEQGLSLSEIGGAAGSINEVFDECRISVGWDIGPCAPSNAVAPPRITVSASAEAATIGKLKVSTYPNPYRNNVRFVIESPVAGQAILDVYNIAGQKIQTLFNGHIDANETRTIDFKPAVANGMMIYTLRIGNQQVTGKLIGLKQ